MAEVAEKIKERTIDKETDYGEEEFSEETQVVGFMMDDEEYGLDIMQVREIITVPKITKIPRAASFIEGIIDLRNSVLPIIDLRKRFLLETKPHTEETRIVVVTIENKECGIVVDSVTEVMRLANTDIEGAPSMVSSVEAQYVKGISRVKRGLIVLLDVDKILSEEEMKQLGEIEAQRDLEKDEREDKKKS